MHVQSDSKICRNLLHMCFVVMQWLLMETEECKVNVGSIESTTSVRVSQKTRVDCNTPVGQKRSRGHGSSKPKSVTPKDQVKDFLGECLTVSGNGKLFCACCL